ncbi:MAG: DUF4255 domain-containing protein [Anaerolineales bacterium]|nr:DUF4255 domain-containing protein [Anaerolineales bacterium]
MYTALRATSFTLSALLKTHFEADAGLRLLFDPSAGGSMVISLNSPQEMTANREQGVSLWLYRVAKDGERLNDPPERISRTQLRRRPLPLSLQYLATPIVALRNNRTSPETEQIILGKILQVFHDHPILSGVHLKDDFSGTELALNIRLETIPTDEAARVFQALDRSYQLSLSYQVGVVMIDSDHEPLSARMVEEAAPDYGLVMRI